MASLAPIGPIRLAPTSSGQTISTTIKNIPKSSIASTKVPKIVSTNVQLQNVSKMKTIVSSNKGFSKVISNNYRHLNIPDKNGDTKLVNVLTTSGNQIRVNTLTAAGKFYIFFHYHYMLYIYHYIIYIDILYNVYVFSSFIAIHSKPTIGTTNGTLSNILQNGKTSLTLATSSSSARVSAASSILLTPNNSVATNITSTTSTISKGRILLSNQLLNNLPT